jgi:hypothetical protein
MVSREPSNSNLADTVVCLALRVVACSPGTNTPQSLNSSTDSSSELAAVVDDLLNQLNSKFTSVSSELLAKSTYPKRHPARCRRVRLIVQNADVDVVN